VLEARGDQALLMSPAVIHHNRAFRMWTVEKHKDEFHLVWRQSTDGLKWSAPLQSTFLGLAEPQPWHLDVIREEDRLSALLVTLTKIGDWRLHYAYSTDDGNTWNVAPFLFELAYEFEAGFQYRVLSTKSFLSAGFKSLDSQQMIIPVIPGFRGFGRTRKVEISFKTREIGSRLNQHEREIWNNHRDLPCTHFLMGSPEKGEYCYGIATTLPIRRVAMFGEIIFNLCYLGKPEFFARHFWSLAGALWREKRLALVRYD
jgi:hypothetical protein